MTGTGHRFARHLHVAEIDVGAKSEVEMRLFSQGRLEVRPIQGGRGSSVAARGDGGGP